MAVIPTPIGLTPRVGVPTRRLARGRWGNRRRWRTRCPRRWWWLTGHPLSLTWNHDVLVGLHKLSPDPDMADVAPFRSAHELLELAIWCVAARETIDPYE